MNEMTFPRGAVVLDPPAGKSEAAARPRREPLKIGWTLARGWLAFLILFIYAPIIVVMGASLDPGPENGLSAFLQFPPNGITFKWYLSIRPELWASLWLSVKLAAMAMGGALLVGFPSALALVRSGTRFAPVLDALFRTPLQIPFIVSGVAFLQAYYALSPLLGIALPGSLTGLFLGHLFVAIPYTTGAIIVALRRIDPRLEDAAMSLGAPYWRVLLRVTIPLVMPGVFAGALYAFLVSFTDVTLSILLSGPDTATFPIWVMNSIGGDLDATLPALSTLVFLVSLAAIFLLQKLLGMETVALSGKNAG